MKTHSAGDGMGQSGRQWGWIAYAAISLLLAMLGWLVVQWREVFISHYGQHKVDWGEMGMDPWQRLSFDVPFITRHYLPAPLRSAGGVRPSTQEVVIVAMDEESAAELGQSQTRPWERRLHVQVLEQLTAQNPRAVLFDLVFDFEEPDDWIFADAIRRNLNTYLGAGIKTHSEEVLTTEQVAQSDALGFYSEHYLGPYEALAEVTREEYIGLLTFSPIDNDYGVRRLFSGKVHQEVNDSWPAATWLMAKSLGAVLADNPKISFQRRWVNYYGPAGTFKGVPFYHVHNGTGGVEPGYFTDKIVLIGARTQLGAGMGKLRDEFSTPWSRFSGRQFTTGVEIHATILLNLLHGDWLDRVSLSTERWAVVLLGFLLAGLRWLRPWFAVTGGLLCALAIFAGSCLLQWQARLWWNWSVPVLLQVPLAVVLAVASRYYLEERRKRKLRRAFSFYLSPELAHEIAERNFVLSPGGEKVVATQVFTDLEGFTTLSEKLGDSARLGQVLNEYFTRTTDAILAERGTVIKFVGDAVHAAWGAPLPLSDHAERAVRAAWRLSQVSALNVPIPKRDGHVERVQVRTRIGIHTGEALAGNLGSSRRFDYAIIGDATNFAARLESANKYTGTTILLSDDTAKLVDGKFLLRRIGQFRVKGRSSAVVIHELLGEDPAIRPPWMDMFEAGLAAWGRGDIPQAEAGFKAAKLARGGTDGPSQFYLDRVGTAVVGANWIGEVVLDEK